MDEKEWNYGEYIIEDGSPFIGGIALLHILTMIQKISTAYSTTIFNFSKYFDKAYEYMDNDRLNKWNLNYYLDYPYIFTLGIDRYKYKIQRIGQNTRQ